MDPERWPALLDSLSAQDPEEARIPISQYVWICRRHRWRILGFCAAAVILTVIISARLTPIFESTTTVDVDRETPPGVVGQDAARSVTNDADQFLATQMKLVQSDGVLRPVDERFRLRLKEKQSSAESPRGEAAPIVLKRLRVTRPPNTYPVARIVRGGNQGPLMWWLTASAAVAATAALALLNREQVKPWFRGAGRWWSAEAARRFLTMSGSMLAGGGAAALVLLAARARILHQQGFAVAGQFDAAWAISMNHVSLVLASLQTYCLPVLARPAGRAERSAHLTRMLTAAALAAAAVVCALALLKPVALALFYSDAFREASRYLRWTLVGDYLKVSSWVLSIPMLASADMRAFLAADLSAYAIFAAGAAIMGHFRGAAEGTAIAFVAMYAAHLAICGSIAWKRYGFRPGARIVLIWAGGLLAVVAASAVTWRAA
jgi:hypothetical protein